MYKSIQKKENYSVHRDRGTKCSGQLKRQGAEPLDVMVLHSPSIEIDFNR
jgi:hypothetical protein